MNEKTNKRPKVKPRRPVLLRLKAMVDPDTGELVKAFVAHDVIDKRMLRERGFKIGEEYRVEIKRSRNSKFFRKAHVLAAWLVDHVDGFAGLQAHAALKRLQEESGVGCTTEAFYLPGVGNCTRKVADSLSFDNMGEDVFEELWDGGPTASHEGGWLGWLRVEKWGDLSPDLIDEVEEMIRKPDGQA